MNKIYQLFIGCLLVFATSGCEEESDMAVERIAAPVVIKFENIESSAEDVLSLKATFFELDKSGILDQNVGIDSIPVANLPISVYINESDLIGEFTTNNEGEIFFEKEAISVSGTRLEWVGVYKEIPFRVYY